MRDRSLRALRLTRPVPTGAADRRAHGDFRPAPRPRAGRLPIALAACCAALVACAVPLPAADPAPSKDAPGHGIPGIAPTAWPSFRNGNLQQGVAVSALPAKLSLLWKYASPDGFEGTATVVDDRVYVGAMSGDFLALDRQKGTKVWGHRSIDDPDPKKFAPAFKAAPLVTADSVFVGDEDGTVHALDRTTGKRRWKFATGAEIAGGAALLDDRLVVGSHDSFLYCLSAKTGELVWKLQTQDRVNCAPSIAEGFTFVAGCDAVLRIVDLEKGRQAGELGLGSHCIASPAVLGPMLYVGNFGGEFHAVDWKKREIVWTYKRPDKDQPYHSSAAVTAKYVVVGCRDKQIHCLDRESGRPVWTTPTKARVDGSPVVVGSRVFVGSSDRNLYELDLATGRVLWTFDTRGDVVASPAVGEGVLVLGTGGEEGQLLCFGAK
jgi:outer membrane protein assembly factor BamB